MGRYSKNLSGQRQAVFVSKAGVNYTDDTTYAAFIANAPEGEIGIFLKAGTVKTDALTAGQEFFIAQKRDGAIHKTPVIAFNDIVSKRKTAYAAPVRKVITVGYNGTSGDVLLDFTGVSSTNVQDVAIAIRETTPANQPFPVQEGRVVVTSASQDEYTVLHNICKQLNGDVDYQRTAPDRFIKADILANGALTELTQNLTVVNGSKTITAAGSITIATGTKVSIRGTVYNVASGGTGTSFTLDRAYQGSSETINVGATTDQAATMAYTSGTTLLGLRITGLYDESHFSVQVEDGLANAPVATATEWVMGSGAGANVVELEQEGFIFAGLGSTLNAEFKADYGVPTAFASSTETYDMYFIDAFPVIRPSAALPVAETKLPQRIIIAAPSSGTTSSDELTTILGL
jgi:hypothetical protein